MFKQSVEGDSRRNMIFRSSLTTTAASDRLITTPVLADAVAQRRVSEFSRHSN